jgi:hypothetical protein
MNRQVWSRGYPAFRNNAASGGKVSLSENGRPWAGVGGYAAEIPHATAVVFRCVTIEQFAPEAAAQMKACEETSRKM